MMEYRVLYYTESYDEGEGSPLEPSFAYVGDNHIHAREAFKDVREHLSTDWTVRLQTREVTLWVTVQGMRESQHA